jgi:ATP-dependent protease HslVU (ClpYQ) peptidase subunit
MTCIVAVRSPGVTVLGADSQSSAGWMKRELAYPKIFARGDFLAGVAGDVRFHNLMRYSFDPPPHHPPDKDDLEYMVVDVAEAVRQMVKDHGYGSKEKEVESIDSYAILVYRGEIYTIHTDFCVVKHIEDYHAIGSAHEIAMGALYAIDMIGVVSGLSAEKTHYRATMALEAAARFNSGVSAPFVYLEQPWPE